MSENTLAAEHPFSKAIEVETFAGKVHVEWDPTAAVTPIGQLPSFIEFLKLGHRFDPWVEDRPPHYVSNNAPQKIDVQRWTSPSPVEPSSVFIIAAVDSAEHALHN